MQHTMQSKQMRNFAAVIIVHNFDLIVELHSMCFSMLLCVPQCPHCTHNPLFTSHNRSAAFLTGKLIGRATTIEKRNRISARRQRHGQQRTTSSAEREEHLINTKTIKRLKLSPTNLRKVYIIYYYIGHACTMRGSSSCGVCVH